MKIYGANAKHNSPSAITRAGTRDLPHNMELTASVQGNISFVPPWESGSSLKEIAVAFSLKLVFDT
jgi:hypothetical protein